MRTTVPERILKIIADIDTQGNASLTRLTVLKQWFEHPGRLSAFGLWIARRAAGRKGKTKGEAGALLNQTRALLGTASTRKSLFQQIDRKTAESLHDRAKAFHREFQNQQWGPVRVIHCWLRTPTRAGRGQTAHAARDGHGPVDRIKPLTLRNECPHHPAPRPARITGSRLGHNNNAAARHVKSLC